MHRSVLPAPSGTRQVHAVPRAEAATEIEAFAGDRQARGKRCDIASAEPVVHHLPLPCVVGCHAGEPDVMREADEVQVWGLEQAFDDLPGGPIGGRAAELPLPDPHRRFEARILAQQLLVAELEPDDAVHLPSALGCDPLQAPDLVHGVHVDLPHSEFRWPTASLRINGLRMSTNPGLSLSQPG